MTNDLYPCPFCGGAGAMLELQNPEDPSTYAVQCTRCRATGAEKDSALQAAHAWNKRLWASIDVYAGDCSVRLLNTLHRGGIHDVVTLLHSSDAELMQIPTFGPALLAELRRIVPQVDA